MVEIIDFDGNPIPNPNKTKKTDKEFLQYHIDPKILKKWDKLREGKLKKKDEDRVYIVDGRERTGKSVLTLQFAKYIDPTFNVDRVCFSPDEFLKQIREAPAGSCVIFDEAFRGLSSKGSQSKINKKIVQAMMEMGQRNLIVFIVLPTFFLLELYAAVLRSNCLFHVYKDKKGKRMYKTYNFSKKSVLFNYGKKKGFSYAIPKVSVRSTGGKFFNIYSISEKKYRQKKLDSLGDTELIREEEEGKYLVEKRKLLAFIKIYCDLTIKKAEEVLKPLNVRASTRTIAEALAKSKENGDYDVICSLKR
tara:strand:+ start:2282 stop:3196 length:915 start_codon:yes stop_codon:yes gene_type:complete